MALPSTLIRSIIVFGVGDEFPARIFYSFYWALCIQEEVALKFLPPSLSDNNLRRPHYCSLQPVPVSFHGLRNSVLCYRVYWLFLVLRFLSVISRHYFISKSNSSTFNPSSWLTCGVSSISLLSFFVISPSACMRLPNQSLFLRPNFLLLPNHFKHLPRLFTFFAT